MRLTERYQALLLIATLGAGTAQWWNAGLVIQRSRVRVPTGVAGEFSFPGSAFCANFYVGIRSSPVLPQ